MRLLKRFLKLVESLCVFWHWELFERKGRRKRNFFKATEIFFKNNISQRAIVIVEVTAVNYFALINFGA